jgi:hypothetical protein
LLRPKKIKLLEESGVHQQDILPMDNHPFTDLTTIVIALIQSATRIALALIARRK